MRTRGSILREIVFTIAAVLSVVVLMVIIKLFLGDLQRDRNLLIFLPFVPVIWLGIKSMRWIFVGAEYLTGMNFTIYGWYGMLIAFVIGLVASPIVIPTGLIILTIQYLKARNNELA